jgi:hypothetical protein
MNAEASYGAKYSYNEISNNGYDVGYPDTALTCTTAEGSCINGDGIQLSGTNTVVYRNKFIRNGDRNNIFEHHLYVSNKAKNFMIQGNRFTDCSNDAVKLTGYGVFANNRIAACRVAISLSWITKNRNIEIYNNIIINGPEFPYNLEEGSQAREASTIFQLTSAIVASEDTIIRANIRNNCYENMNKQLLFHRQNGGRMTFDTWRSFTNLNLDRIGSREGCTANDVFNYDPTNL